MLKLGIEGGLIYSGVNGFVAWNGGEPSYLLGAGAVIGGWALGRLFCWIEGRLEKRQARHVPSAPA